MQFLGGTAESMMDILTPDRGPAELLKVLHDFYLTELEFWVATDVYAIMFMDDWGNLGHVAGQGPHRPAGRNAFHRRAWT